MHGRVKIALGLGTALLVAGTLASCSKGGGGTAAAFNEAPSSSAYTVTPGQYESTVKITNFTSQGLPPEIVQEIERAKSNPMTQRACLPIGISLESASLKNLRIAVPGNMGGCNFGNYSFEGGNFSAALSCDIRNIPARSPDAPRALTIAASMNGTYNGDQTNGTAHLEVNEPGGARSGAIDIEISSKRVGDCPAGSDPFGPRPYSPTPNYSPPMTTNTTTTTNTYDSNMSGGYSGGNTMGGGYSSNSSVGYGNRM